MPHARPASSPSDPACLPSKKAKAALKKAWWGMGDSQGAKAKGLSARFKDASKEAAARFEVEFKPKVAFQPTQLCVNIPGARGARPGAWCLCAGVCLCARARGR